MGSMDNDGCAIVAVQHGSFIGDGVAKVSTKAQAKAKAQARAKAQAKPKAQAKTRTRIKAKPEPNANDDIVRLRRRQARATETRKKILDAATVEFSSRGFEGTTTRSIASTADVPHALVVYHFETKQGVWQAVVARTLQDFHDEVSDRMKEMEGHDDITILRELMRTFIRLSAKRPEINWLVDHEAGGGSERMQWLVENVLSRDIGLTVQLITKAQRAGRFVEGDPAHLHFLWLGASSRVFTVSPMIKKMVGASPFDPEFVEEHIKLCERLFFRDPPKAK